MNATVTKLKVFALSLLALSVINCSKSGGGSSSPSTNTCSTAGTTYTAVGCLPSCGTGMVYYNNQCVSAAQLGGGAAVSCGTGKLQSQYGCLLQCGTNSVWYNNQCVPAYSTGGITGIPGIGGTTGYPNTGMSNICSGRCAPGQVETYNGCLPQYSCGACYGYANGWCVIGVNAHAYYGF